MLTPAHYEADVLFFFDGKPLEHSLYEALLQQLDAVFPDTSVKVQKSQISFYARHLFAAVSLPVRRRKSWPEHCLLVTFGLSHRLSAPELGFLFPAFDDRSTNLYNSLYYTRDIAENHAEFVDAVFRSPVPMPAAAQKETFQSILGDTLAEDSRYEVVQAVHEQLCGMIEEHKAGRETEPLVISKGTVKCMLKSCGVADSHVATFDQQYDAAFGADTDLSPRNLVDAKQLELRTPDVTIHVNPEHSDLVETRVIDGKRYILIRADDGVEVNGVNVHIS